METQIYAVLTRIQLKGDKNWPIHSVSSSKGCGDQGGLLTGERQVLLPFSEKVIKIIPGNCRPDSLEYHDGSPVGAHFWAR